MRVEETRICSECGEEKPITEFPLAGNRKGNDRKPYCRRCAKRMREKKWKQRNAERVRKKRHERYLRDRAAEDARAAALGYERGSMAHEKHQMTKNDKAELTALRIVEILEVAPELVTEAMWEKVCVLLGGESFSGDDLREWKANVEAKVKALESKKA